MKYLIVAFLLVCPTLIFAQTYEKEDGKLKAVEVKQEFTYYTVDQIQEEIRKVDERLSNNLAQIESNKKDIIEKSKEEKLDWITLLKQAVATGLTTHDAANDYLKERSGQVRGVNWTNEDLLK